MLMGSASGARQSPGSLPVVIRLLCHSRMAHPASVVWWPVVMVSIHKYAGPCFLTWRIITQYRFSCWVSRCPIRRNKPPSCGSSMHSSFKVPLLRMTAMGILAVSLRTGPKPGRQWGNKEALWKVESLLVVFISSRSPGRQRGPRRQVQSADGDIVAPSRRFLR